MRSGNQTVFRGSFQHLQVVFSGYGKAAGFEGSIEMP
jgi:hypothetical protein